MEVEAARPAGATAQRYRFAILAVVWTAYLVVYLARLTVGPLSPFLKDALSLDNAQVGGLTSATGIAYGPTLIVAGWLADRYGVRRLLVAGTFVAGTCVVLMFFANSYAVLFGLLVLSGLGCGCIYPSAVRAVMLWFPPRERATAIGVNQAAINVSGVIGRRHLAIHCDRLRLLPLRARTSARGLARRRLFAGARAHALRVRSGYDLAPSGSKEEQIPPHSRRNGGRNGSEGIGWQATGAIGKSDTKASRSTERRAGAGCGGRRG